MTHMSGTLVEKRLGLLLQLVPRAAVIGMLINPVSQEVIPEIKAMQAAMQQQGLRSTCSTPPRRASSMPPSPRSRGSIRMRS